MLALLGPLGAAAQVVGTFAGVEKQGIRIAHLDSTYRSAVHADTSRAAFPGREQEVAVAYGKLLQSLGSYLKQHQFAWGKPARCFNRVYFRPDGRIDYFLFNFRPGEITLEQEAAFQKLVADFCRTARLGLTNRVPFAQCSPVTYRDASGPNRAAPAGAKH